MATIFPGSGIKVRPEHGNTEETESLLVEGEGRRLPSASVHLSFMPGNRQVETGGTCLSNERGVIFIGHKPNRADFLNFLDGVEFASATLSKLLGILAGQQVQFISLEDYVATKKASGRPKDTSDLALLKAVRPEIKL